MAKIDRVENNDELVKRARTEAEALGELYELYYKRIFRFCVHRLFSKEAAEDVTSAVFLDVARKIRTFTGRSEADFRNWLYAITANKANDYIRKTSRRKELFAEAVRLKATNSTNRADRSSEIDWPRIYVAMLQLAPKQQTIVTLRFFEDLSFAEIARILNTKETTVRVILHRAVKKLKNHLQTVKGTGE